VRRRAHAPLLLLLLGGIHDVRASSLLLELVLVLLLLLQVLQAATQ